jgi:FixJ family two-component response regulator
MASFDYDVVITVKAHRGQVIRKVKADSLPARSVWWIRHRAFDCIYARRSA